MEEKKGFNRADQETGRNEKSVFIKIGLMLVSLVLAVFTAVVINI